MNIDELMATLEKQSHELEGMTQENDLSNFDSTFGAIVSNVSEIWRLYPQDFLLSVAFYAIQDAQTKYLSDALAGNKSAFAAIKSIVKQQVEALLLH